MISQSIEIPCLFLVDFMIQQLIIDMNCNNRLLQKAVIASVTCVCKLRNWKCRRILEHLMELDISLQKLHCQKHLTSPRLPPEKNSAVLGDLEK